MDLVSPLHYGSRCGVHGVSAARGYDSESGSGKRSRAVRAAMVVAAIATVCFSAAVMLSGSQGGQRSHTSRATELLMSGLCCDGCCKAGTAVLPFPTLDSPARAQVLHIDDKPEIDYTSDGHRVPQHMESAMNEVGSTIFGFLGLLLEFVSLSHPPQLPHAHMEDPAVTSTPGPTGVEQRGMERGRERDGNGECGSDEACDQRHTPTPLPFQRQDP
jgi:hypothetical protein